jgi:3-oxoacyl-[acyl-carrier protein] reductase
VDLSLEGRNALVCGGSRGIGRAAAEALAGLGARITLVARDQEALDAAVAGLAHGADRHTGVSADLGDTDGIDRVLEAAAAAGPTHILVNNSGGPPAGPALGADPEQFTAAFRQHLLASHALVRALVPGMRTEGYGRIINVISTSVREPIAGLGVSNTIRGAMASWSKTLSGELGGYGITVNNVLPGFTATERLDYFFEVQARKAGRSVEDMENAALQRIPAGRFARPEEIGNAVAFLASPAAAYINGVSLAVDGGLIRGL